MPPSVPETYLERKPPALLFLNSKHSRAATLGPPGSPLDPPLPARLAVDAPPDSAPPRAHSALPATSENALSKAASARARIPDRRTLKCESLFRVGCGRRTGSPRKGRLAISPGTTAPAS